MAARGLLDAAVGGRALNLGNSAADVNVTPTIKPQSCLNGAVTRRGS